MSLECVHLESSEPLTWCCGRPEGCGTDITLPVMLSCADWTAEALADGQITEQDNFCRSECHGGLERMVACRGQMSEVIEQSLDVLTPMVGRCAQMLRPPQRGDGGGAGAPECHMDAVREACGAPGVQDDLCTDACLGIMKRTWDACTDGQGTGDAQFADYSDKVSRIFSAAQNLEWRY